MVRPPKLPSTGQLRRVPPSIASRIIEVRGVRVILDVDLAEAYGVSTKVLNQAVRRNANRFPRDFAFTLTVSEAHSLRSQIVTSNGRGGRRYAPRAFTEHGIAMLSSVLRSERAVRVNVAIMRAFVRLRALAMTHRELTERLDGLERKYDGKFTAVFNAIRRIVDAPTEPEEPRRRIGFVVDQITRSSRTRARP